MKVEKLAIPVFEKRISPLFDVAGSFEIIATKEKSIIEKTVLDTSKLSGIERVQRLKDLEVNVIICSAISRIFANSVISKGIELIPGVIGFADEVVDAYIKDNLRIDMYSMPGCRWQKRFRGRRCPNYNDIFFNTNNKGG